jgi:hypothetical protein
MIAVARAKLSALRADCLLCCHDRFYIETAFIAAARQLGIPTVFLQEGPFCVIGHTGANAPRLKLKYALAPLARMLGLTPGMPDYGLAGHDRICAASDAYKQAWLHRGVPAERVRVTGVPRYDPLVQAHARYQNRSRSTSAKVPKVMVLAQPFGAHGKVDTTSADRAMRTTGVALDRVARSRQVDLRIRTHPRSNSDEILPLTSRLAQTITIETPDQPFPERAVDLDLVVGFYSSAVLEALAIGVPCVCCRLPMHAFAEPGEAAKQTRLVELGVPLADTPDRLAAHMDTLLDEPENRPASAMAEHELGPLDGRASERTSRIILDLVAGEGRAARTNVADDAA